MPAESPEHLRTSLAAAMTLDLKSGLFYRNAKSPCVNLLLTYDDGCAGRCAYCGLSLERQGAYGDKSFIRVGWPAYRLSDMMERIAERGSRVKRVCISMITNERARGDVSEIIQELRNRLEIPISLLVTPTILEKNDLMRYKAEGVDMAGVAVDCATPELFGTYRGSGVGGPHTWNRYWQCLEEAIDVFGEGMAGAHLIVGLGETEREMAGTMQKVHDLGGYTHLFSFFPEKDSMLAERPLPPIGQYRRMQLARYLVDEGTCSSKDFKFDATDRLTSFGLPDNELATVIETGRPFMTSGCAGRDGEVACNRPYANCVPGQEIRNYPFTPDDMDIKMIGEQLWRRDKRWG
ncbi:MAG: radical SAM protein [Euryarchaeota archaeon]|nr:radical SAM protein [Euryarchaeota archaeon]